MAEKKETEAQVEALIEVLYDHLARHRELAAVLEEKEKILLEFNLSELDGVIERERSLVERIGAGEERRIELTTGIGKKLGLENPSSTRLSAMVPFVAPELADVLIEVRDQLRDVALEIEKIQSRNRTLIGTSLDHIHLFFSVLSGNGAENESYSPKGAPKAHTDPAVLDRRF